MEPKKEFSVSERKWIVREILSGRMNNAEAYELIRNITTSPVTMLVNWKKIYKPEISFTLPAMTEKERQKLEAAQKRMKELEKQLEEAQMKNIALDTMIDIAEEQLKITIRKKFGPKQ